MMLTINSKEIMRLMETGALFTVVNVLEKESYDLEHICGSINIPVEEMETEAPGLIGTDERVIVHCSGPKCTASEVACTKLEGMGYRNVERFTGGIEEWKKAGYCIEGKEARKAA
ncbi:MAG TPA: rhodanese-like domain-containing protein [Thermodesulfobacteriota bacterium]|nr:rhodanese-like domain-containing protein [Thermodesulfobacteriota bacterium]